jgi:hypothetical protein
MTMKYIAVRDINISVGGRLIEAKMGETYELSREEIKKIPEGYFEADDDKLSEEARKPIQGALDILASESEEPRFEKKRGRK